MASGFRFVIVSTDAGAETTSACAAAPAGIVGYGNAPAGLSAGAPHD
ncbi:MAG: hypothetical protein LKK47_06900 [Bifidobacterium thermacidophilum]|nr:hypothetical protein [Bifidobacterium thermacidophilum]